MSSRRQALAAALLPLLLLASAGPDWRVFRCRHDQVTRLSPCCADEQSDDDSDSVGLAAIDSDDGCCDAQSVKFVHVDFVRHGVSHSVDLPPIIGTPVPSIPLLASRVHPLESSPAAIVDTGPPVLLKTRSLLI